MFGVVSCKDNTHVHSMESVAAVEATCTEDGNIAYYKCSVCGKYFSDADGKEEITADSVVIPAKVYVVNISLMKQVRMKFQQIQ